MNKTKITKESLLKYGMVETEGTEAMIFPLKKVISVKDEERDEEEDGDLAICVTNLRNRSELCLSFPNGDILYLCCQTIEELDVFERCIESWEPNY